MIVLNPDEYEFIEDEENTLSSAKTFVCLNIRGQKLEFQKPEDIAEVIEKEKVEKELPSIQHIDKRTEIMNTYNISSSDLCLLKEIVYDHNIQAMVTLIKKYYPEDSEEDIVSLLEEDTNYEPSSLDINEDNIFIDKFIKKMIELNSEAFDIIKDEVIIKETSKFDEESRDTLFSDPKQLVFLQLDAEKGIFQIIMNQIERVKDKAKYVNMNTLTLYNYLKQKLQKKELKQQVNNQDRSIDKVENSKQGNTSKKVSTSTKGKKMANPSQKFKSMNRDDQIDLIVQTAYKEYKQDKDTFLNKFHR
jgi:hypothetical protein